MVNSEPLAVGRDADLYSSGVSWGAVIGGAFVAAALSLIMLALGAGFGLEAVSPWSRTGSATAVGTAEIIWLIVVEAVSCAFGGYLAGRLRTRWVSIHTDEVHFRDTASGLLVWAVGLVMTVAFMTTAAVSMAGAENARESAMAANGGGPEGARRDLAYGYYVDRLFRSEHPAAGAEDAAVRAEAGMVLAHALHRPDTASDDVAWLGRLVAARTGLNQSEADQRVSTVLNDARQAEDAARKAAAHVLLWIFLALLIGAFCASYAATIGGRQRDHVRPI